MFPNLKADIARYIKKDDSQNQLKEILYLLFDQGFWAVMVYRFCHWAHQIQIPILSILLKLFSFFLSKATEVMTGISIPASAQIGPGFYVGHFGGIILHTQVKMGKDSSIGSGVVIGTRGLGDQGVPTIGDNVYIGVGAKVLGKVKIGNDVKIGANAVVLDDIPDGATVVGIPAQIVRRC